MTTCEMTDVPAADEIDIPALRAKYKVERDKRLRPEGQGQYLKTEKDFADTYEHDPYTPLIERDPLSEDLDVAILGAGWSGLLAAYHLKQAGVNSFRNIDLAGDFGGCWYWNRYPGIQCDNESYCYIPLLEETGYMPSKKFIDGWEIHEHFQRIANQFGLYENALFHTLIRTLRWDESIQRWRLTTNRGDDIRARFVIMCGGPLNRPKLPGIPGIKDFKGTTFHTARWDYDYTGGDRKAPVLSKLADKRVAIIGTGATAVQAVPYLGKYCKQLYVIQRTPSSVDARKNGPTDPEWVKSLPSGWQRERQINFHHGAMESFAPGEPDLISDIWTEISRNLSAEFEAEGWPQLSFDEFMARREVMDYRVMERLRRRIEEIVEDKDTAEAMKPWYRFLCKRPTSNDDYLPTFNRPNVKLIDVSDTQGLERMTEKGFVHKGEEYEIDCMIFASGYEVTSDLDRRWGIDVIDGRDGLSLFKHWEDGYRTLHGLMTTNFPNQFFTGFIQGGLNANLTTTLGMQGLNIAYIIKQALDRGVKVVEPSVEAQDAWVKTMHDTAINVTDFARECTPGYFNNEGEEKARWYLGEAYGPGYYAFEQLMDEWRSNGKLEGLVLTR